MLLHLITTDAWADAAGAQSYRPPTYDADGFIHLSTAQQVHLPANRIFAGRKDLLLLVLDEDLLSAEVRWEPGVPTDPSSMLFPHLYGELPTAAVQQVAPYLPELDGQFGPPTRLGPGR